MTEDNQNTDDTDFDRYEQRRIFAYHAHKLGCQ